MIPYSLQHKTTWNKVSRDSHPCKIVYSIPLYSAFQWYASYFSKAKIQVTVLENEFAFVVKNIITWISWKWSCSKAHFLKTHLRMIFGSFFKKVIFMQFLGKECPKKEILHSLAYRTRLIWYENWFWNAFWKGAPLSIESFGHFL